MAGGWVKTLQCKSRAYEDVYRTTNCRDSYLNLKDVVNVDHSNKEKPNPKPKSKSKSKPKPKFRSDPFVKPKTESKTVDRVKRTVLSPLLKESDLGPMGPAGPFFPSVAELAKDHPSRNVVEIIFGTRWGPRGFPGRVETVLKVLGPARGPTLFEEYRNVVRLRAGPGSGARLAADGNEMMRFRCLGGGGAAAACTYSGSGAAHESAGGGGGTRAMVVCRVIAGRVLKRAGPVDPVGDKCSVLGEFDSVSGKNGELLVFDSRAVLPCFLVIYRL